MSRDIPQRVPRKSEHYAPPPGRTVLPSLDLPLIRRKPTKSGQVKITRRGFAPTLKVPVSGELKKSPAHYTDTKTRLDYLRRLEWQKLLGIDPPEQRK